MKLEITKFYNLIDRHEHAQYQFQKLNLELQSQFVLDERKQHGFVQDRSAYEQNW